MQTEYEIELQGLKNWDEIQNTVKDPKDFGYDFIPTAGHGYLIVPVNDKHIQLARSICTYGFIGKLAVYLEEDDEVSEFLSEI